MHFWSNLISIPFLYEPGQTGWLASLAFPRCCLKIDTATHRLVFFYPISPWFLYQCGWTVEIGWSWATQHAQERLDWANKSILWGQNCLDKIIRQLFGSSNAPIYAHLLCNLFPNLQSFLPLNNLLFLKSVIQATFCWHWCPGPIITRKNSADCNFSFLIDWLQ